MPLQKLQDFIVEIPNVISLELCNQIIAEYETSGIWEKAPIRCTIDTFYRNCETIKISLESVIEQNIGPRKNIDNSLYFAFGQALAKYQEQFPHTDISEDTGYNLLRYQTGCFYKEHTDSFTAQPRTISCSLALNDNFEGGEFSLLGGVVKRKVPKGSVLMFPSNFMYPHEILPIELGTRYSIVTWFR